MAQYRIAAVNHVSMKKRLSAVLITSIIIFLAVFPACVYFSHVIAPSAGIHAGMVRGLALAAGRERVGRNLKVLLVREIDSVIMGSCKECTGN